MSETSLVSCSGRTALAKPCRRTLRVEPHHYKRTGAMAWRGWCATHRDQALAPGDHTHEWQRTYWFTFTDSLSWVKCRICGEHR